ncbi:MAG TPA: hypothetical protein V6C88_04415 [Chroococcidiopsis sp.]
MPNTSTVQIENSANAVFYAALDRLCRRDRHLAAIGQARASGESAGVLVLDVQKDFVPIVYKKLMKIIRLIALSGDPFGAIAVNDEVLQVADLKRLCPAIAKPTGSYDRRSMNEQQQQVNRRYRALLGFEATKGTIFIISTAGVYLEVLIHEGTTSRIPPEDMIGKPLDAILPLETALHITQQIKAAYAEGKRRKIQYGIWERRYESEVIPVPGADQCFLVCVRL